MKVTGDYTKFDILEFPNVLPVSVCKKAIELYEKNLDLVFKPTEMFPGMEYRQGGAIDVDLYLDYDGFKPMSDRYNKLITAINLSLKNRYKAIEKSIILHSGIQLLKYSPGEVVLEHSDGLFDSNLPASSGFATMVVYLNTPSDSKDDGGGTYFKRQDAVVKAEVGKCLIFPPYHTHIHGSLPSKDDRYIMSTWLHLKHFTAS